VLRASVTGPRLTLEQAPRMLTVREVAERLRVSSSTVYGLCERGELPHLRVSNAIRIRPEDLDEFLARWRRTR
jgi:excisionase family DNA binding protein